MFVTIAHAEEKNIYCYHLRGEKILLLCCSKKKNSVADSSTWRKNFLATILLSEGKNSVAGHLVGGKILLLSSCLEKKKLPCYYPTWRKISVAALLPGGKLTRENSENRNKHFLFTLCHSSSCCYCYFVERNLLFFSPAKNISATSAIDQPRRKIIVLCCTRSRTGRKRERINYFFILSLFRPVRNLTR